MGSLTHRQYSDKRFKQTSGCKDFIREFLYIRWVNSKCQAFLKILNDDDITEYEPIFWSSKTTELTEIFRNFLEVKIRRKFQNFSKLDFKLSSVNFIHELKGEMYYLISNKLNPDFVLSDDEFQDLFENLIVFTHRIFLKKEEDYEDDIFDINEYRGNFPVIDDDFDSDSESEFEFYNDISSDSESDSD